jgi:hypothetical protein
MLPVHGNMENWFYSQIYDETEVTIIPKII